ncbi:MAG TPA: PBP1A family penicillin-binding protein [Vicinamibacterales bacterium]|nr:PBP1A family penicillin-binding protein [Vicinamibacterales bacterium]
MIEKLRLRMAEMARAWRGVRTRSPRLAAGVGGAVALVVLVVVGSGAVYLIGLSRGLPDAAAMSRIGEMDQATAVLDASDQLAFTVYKEQRIDVPLSGVSPLLIKAILATEDQRFYEHHGFDVRRILSAALANVRHRRVAQGASTITQQLARQSFLTPDKTVRRKLQELILAARLERQYSKPRILELYLNKVYFGDGLYGVEAASRGFFGKHASELNVQEAATLAGLVKSPSSYAPTVSLERATARRNVVLQAMLDTGAIARPEWQAARASKIVVHDGLRAGEPHGQYFKEQVRRELVDRFGWQRVYQGGLRVYSTIDMKMQAAAESAVADSLKIIDERRQALAARRATAKAQPVPALSDLDTLQAALIALDPETGHVRAMVGGRDFNESNFNRAVQARRQPGSAFKPFVYATAIEAGYTPATMIDHLDEPIDTLQGAWTPEDEHSTATSMSLRTGLRTSSNRAAVRLLQEVGIPETVKSAKQMGVGDVPSVPSLALGSGEVTLQSMATAYAAFANHGLVPHALLIRRVEDRDGRVLFEERDSSSRAISDTTAFLMTTMLADVVNAGTGNRARQMGFTLPAAGKTGTTNDFNDAWFVGYTPSLVAGVWVGFDQPHTILPNGFAADLAVPMWTRFMKVATIGDKPDWLAPPQGITTASVCRLSGKLATIGCQDAEVVSDDGRRERRSMVYTEYFARGTAPQSYCDLHPTRGLMTKLAGIFTAPERPATRIETVSPPPAPDVAPGAPPEPFDAAPAPAKKKRGFWAKVFGIGKDDDRKQNDPQKKRGGK